MSILNNILGGPNVTVDNPSVPGTIYLQGSEFVDGSVRLRVLPDGTVQVQIRVAGEWVLGDIEFGVGTWLVDDDLGEFVLDPAGELVFEG